MSCFSLDFWMRVCIFIVIAIGIWMMIQLFLPLLLTRLPALVVSIIRIIAWVAVAIFCILVIFALLSCLISAGGGLLPFPHH